MGVGEAVFVAVGVFVSVGVKVAVGVGLVVGVAVRVGVSVEDGACEGCLVMLSRRVEVDLTGVGFSREKEHARLRLPSVINIREKT